MKTHFI